MAEHNDLGKLGEELAVDFLEKNSYEILETNWTFQKAEVDIIAIHANGANFDLEHLEAAFYYFDK